MSGIQIENLTKEYDGVAAVRALNLTVSRGEFLTLLGPSGSGKTTTLRMVAGLEKPDGGTISVGGRVLNGAQVDVPTHQRNLGMVFQSYAIWPHKTIFENIAFPLSMRGVGRSEQQNRVNHLLEMVGLQSDEYGPRYPAQLSGGQQQRVALARALVGDPQVLLYDEPLSNLDARLRDSMRTLMRTIHNQFEVTSLYVTHDQIEAMVLSDRVCVMRDGKIIQDGSPQDLYERPAEAFVAEFIGQANVLPVLEADRENSTVTLVGGTVVNVEKANWRSETPRQLIVRYHQIKPLMSVEQGSASNVFQATVRDVIYLGDRIRYGVDLGAPSQLVGEIVAGDGLFKPGEKISVQLPASSCIVI